MLVLPLTLTPRSLLLLPASNRPLVAGIPILSELVMCLTNSWCFVAPKMGWGEARRGSISAAICDRGATKPPGHFRRNPSGRSSFGLPRRCSFLTDPEGYARRSRLAGGQNPLRQNTSYL